MSKSSGPDPYQLAQQQAALNTEVGAQQNWANRPTQKTPWGTTSWGTEQVVDPGTGKPVTHWTQNQELDPGLQTALTDQINMQNQRSQLAGSFMNRVGNAYSQTPDDIFNSLPLMHGDLMGTLQITHPEQYQAQTNVNAPSLDQARLQGTTNPNETVGTSGQDASYIAPTTNSDQYTSRTDVTGQDISGLPQYTNPNQSVGVTGQDTSKLNQYTNTSNQQLFGGERQRIEQAAFDRMQPQHDRQLNEVRTNLANQGITPGSEAYKQEMQRVGDQQSRERFDALQYGGTEQQRMQSELLAQQQQAFGQQQAAQSGQNQALSELQRQQLASGQFGLGAQQQAFGQAQGGQASRNQALSELQRQGIASGQFGLGAQQQQYAQQGASQDRQNAARMNDFQQRVQSGEFGLKAQEQGFQQGKASQDTYNQNQLAQQQADLARAGFYNAGQQQNYQQNLNANQQNWNQQVTAANFGNQQRQQILTEMLQKRNMPLNEMNALLTGQQVTNPNMPSFNQAANMGSPDLMGAQQNAANAANQSQQGMMSGVMGLGSAAVMAF
jgi:hypothetical protein